MASNETELDCLVKEYGEISGLIAQIWSKWKKLSYFCEHNNANDIVDKGLYGQPCTHPEHHRKTLIGNCTPEYCPLKMKGE